MLKSKAKKQKNYTFYIVAVFLLIIIAAGYKFLVSLSGAVQSGDIPNNIKADNVDLEISKKDVTEKVKFYSYDADGTYMEVLAVKADDGSIRTALNTCQICYNSGRGYYEQQGDTVVCQNCGNIFDIGSIEIVKGGCNPVPIFDENKTISEEKIAISGDFLNNNKEYFSRWKK